MNKEKVELRKGNDTRVIAFLLGSMNFKLSLGDFLSLEECYYAPCIFKNIISIYFLDKMVYTLIIKDNYCSIYFGSKLADMTPLFNGLYPVNVSSYNLQVDVALKKSKQSVNESYLRHCKLGHVGNKR